MARRIVIAFAGLMLMAAPAWAQRIEVSFGGGYTASEGIAIEEHEVAAVFYDRLEIASGPSFHFSFGAYTTPRMLIEFMYGRQSSTLKGDGPAGSIDVSEMSVNSYHGLFTYHWAELDAPVRPFAFGGLGATNYSFGSLLIDQPPGGDAPRQISGETQFSTTWGAGVKFHPGGGSFGIKVMGRWTPTYLKSTAEGYWCDPWYGCWVVGDADYSHQFDISGGITFKF